MRSKKWMVLTILLSSGLFAVIEVNAQQEAYTLPVITQWEDGYGYQEDGTQILDAWAYDSVNPAGKYVLFGANGYVLKKTEDLSQTDIENDYTGTELVQATIAVRADVFEGFCGTVTILLEENSGQQKNVELNEQNFYGLNVPIHSGTYVLQSVEAKEENTFYVVEYPDEAFSIGECEIYMLNLRVTDGLLETEKIFSETTELEAENLQEESQKGEKQEADVGKEETVMQDNVVRKLLAFAGGIGTACMAGIWLWKKKRKNRR